MKCEPALTLTVRMAMLMFGRLALRRIVASVRVRTLDVGLAELVMCS